MRYCSTWLRSLLCYIKKFLIEEFVVRVLHSILNMTYVHAYMYSMLNAIARICLLPVQSGD